MASNFEIEKLYKTFNSSESGLSSSQAIKNQQLYGKNELAKQKKVSLIKRFFLQFKNIMVIVLLISALISFSIALFTKQYGDLFEGGLIFIIVILNAIIGVFQEKRADDALALLSKKTAPMAKVYRDGKLTLIASEDVVVGDIVELKAGDFVPADIRLISSTNLKCDESTLTGESQSVYKNANAISNSNHLAEQENMCFSGTNCTFGKGKGIVVKVGKNSEIGKIAKLLNHAKEKTPLEKNIDKIGKFITIGVLIITAVVFVVELIFSKGIGFLDAFLIAVALAVAAIPESLPAVITIVMALGVERLARQGAIVKTLSSVETLGCCNVICSDKTGTLTQNKMTVKDVFIDLEFNKNNSLTLPEVFNCITLCNNAKQDQDGVVIGDATETSLLNFAKTHFKSYEKCKNYPRLYEFAFDSNRKIMSTVNNIDGQNILFSKGAYDYLIEHCNSIMIEGQTLPLNENHKKVLEQAIITMGRKAERVIALTKKVCEKSASQESEENLTFLGLVGIIDPPRPEAKQAIKKCFKAGLRPVMITGDHPETAFAIAKELGLAKSKKEVMTGKELDSLSKKQLASVIESYSVFARVTPEHKVKIVEAFKKKGKVVAMTGDGVNDAPSISRADIGTCMGKAGTDVTKSVADLVITDDNFSTIVVAIEQGRTIYSNIQKIIQFLMSTNAVEVLGIFTATIVMRDSVFLLPSQILFINLVTDSFPAFALGLEKPEKNIMERPPRNAKETIFSGKTGTNILYQSFVQTFMVLIIFVIAVHKWSNSTASTMVFLIICYMQIIHAINCKTNESLLKINIFNNPTFNISFIGLFALISLTAFVPFMQKAFNIVPLSLVQWLIVSIASIAIIPLVEICKLVVNFSYKKKKKEVYNPQSALIK